MFDIDYFLGSQGTVPAKTFTSFIHTSPLGPSLFRTALFPAVGPAGIKRAARFCSCMLLTTQSSGRMIEAFRRTNGLACRPERFSNAYKRFCRRVKTHGGKAGMRPRRRFYCLALCLSQTISTATSAGETPGMRDACPRETGRWTVSFWRASRRSASMCI